MAVEKEMKLAVLIDAENISGKYIEVILSEANALGNVIYKRIYGNWTNQNMGAWRDVILDNSIQPIQQYNNAAGKNATDSSLIIDAMDLLYMGRLNGFCIVSSDSDFTRLAARLRESEMYVLGMGERKTPQSFVSACNKFAYLDILYMTIEKERAAEAAKNGKKAEGTKRGSKKNAPDEEKAGSNMQIIRQALQLLAEEKSDDDGWIFSGKLGALLSKRFPDFDVRNFGYKRFVPFVESLKLFESKRDEADKKLVYFRMK